MLPGSSTEPNDPESPVHNLMDDMIYVGGLVMLARGATLRGDGSSFGGVDDSQGTADLGEGSLSLAAGGVYLPPPSLPHTHYCPF
jgi:hypothetical protein